MIAYCSTHITIDKVTNVIRLLLNADLRNDAPLSGMYISHLTCPVIVYCEQIPNNCSLVFSAIKQV